MSDKRFSYEGSPYHASTTNPDQLYNLLRRRAASCSSMSNAGLARTPYTHLPSSAAHVFTSPRPLSQVWALSSNQTSFTSGSRDDHGAEYNGWGITQDGFPGSAPQGSPGTEASSVLGFEPGPATQYRHGAMPFDYQQSPNQSTNSLLADDPSLSAASLDCPFMGPTVTITQAPPEPFDMAIHASPTDYEAFTALLPPGYPNPRMTSSPSSPYQSKNATLMPDSDVLLRPPQGSETPSSPSIQSSGSPSPRSFAALTLNSPRSSIGDMDDDFLQRSFTGQDRQYQAGPQWEKGGLITSQPPISPNPSFWAGIGPESPGSGPFSTMPPTAPAPEMVELIEEADFGYAETSDVKAITPGPSLGDLSSTFSRYPQTFSGESFHPLMGRAAASGSFQPHHPAERFPILPGTSCHQETGVSGSKALSHRHSDPSAPLKLAGPSFSLQVNESYGRPLDGQVVIGQGIGTSCPLSTARADIAHGAIRSRHNDASKRKTGGWCNENSRAKEDTRVVHNRLLHISITALENGGRVPRTSSLRDTLRFIIRDCFPRCHPTRQQIVDLLFGELPENIQMDVVELAVKKYYKDRVGHILSAPPNKKIFINLEGGRWRLGEES